MAELEVKTIVFVSSPDPSAVAVLVGIVGDGITDVEQQIVNIEYN